MRLAVSTCAAQNPDALIQIEESYPGQADADLFIRLGEPAPLPPFIAQIAGEELLLIVHPANQSASLTLDEVADIFSGRMRRWSEIGGDDRDIQVWVPLKVDETRQAFQQKVLKGGLVTPNAFLAPHPSAMLEAVSGNLDAIGYLPKAWSTGEVATIYLGIEMPVLVVADEEPQGAARELVACLQGDLGQSILEPFYIVE
jgi:phosphate transport system substrate-binding protein